MQNRLAGKKMHDDYQPGLYMVTIYDQDQLDGEHIHVLQFIKVKMSTQRSGIYHLPSTI